MKIRFHSAKERNPTQDNGLEVLYGPGKRLAFRLRWYAIVLLVLFPALWLAGRYGLDMVRIEAPALVRLPTLEIRARQAGRVQALHVQAGDHVQAQSPLVDMDNPEWSLRLALLLGEEPATAAGQPDLVTRNRAALASLVQRARDRVASTRALVDGGAATRGELIEAQNQLNSREAELLAFERSLLGGAGASEADRYAQQREAERQWLVGQMDNLKVSAPESGRVVEVLAAEGENVGPGTPLLRLERSGPAQLWIYLDPKDVEHSSPGARLEVRLPDGRWLGAEVINAAESANPLPTDLRKPFTSPTRGLLVPARFTEPLAEEWRVDSLPVRVRFPNERFTLLGMTL